jgi:hypothetical protein
MPTLIRRLPFAALWSRRPQTAPCRHPRPPLAHAPSPAPAIASTRDLELEELRGAAMRRMFPKLFSWCADRWDRGMAVEVHNYLAGATSLDDLERRIRLMERRRHFAS